MSQSSDSCSDGGHPIDDVLDNRAKGGSNTQQISSPESGELAQTLASNKRKPAPQQHHQSDTSDDEEDVIIKYRKTKKQKPSVEPLGVTVLEEGEEDGRTSEMRRLLRQPRYFDTDDFEEFGSRCYNCGQVGHLARDCTSPILRQRSCFLCAQVGHDSRDCPNSLCWKCQEPGHLARDCPHKHTHLVREIVCLRCGRSDCPCAGHSDAYRAEGNCAFSYSSRDLQQIRCYACGQLGHLNCAPYVAPLPVKPTCYNCGGGGHFGEECTREAPAVMRAERNNMMREHRESNNNNNNRERSTMGGGGGGGFRGGGNNSNNSRGNFTWSRNYTTGGGGYNNTNNTNNEMKAVQQRIRNEQKRGSIGIDNRDADAEGSKKKRKVSNSTDTHSSGGGGGKQAKKKRQQQQQSTASQGGGGPSPDNGDGGGQKRKKRRITEPAPAAPRSRGGYRGGDSKRGGNQGNNGNNGRKFRSGQNKWTRQ